MAIGPATQVHSGSSPIPVDETSVSSSTPRRRVDGSQAKTIFTHGEKWFIVAICGFSGTFSPLTSNIYFPALPTLASQFQVSDELINLTVTVYMVMQAVAPSFWGTLADRYGRRPFFLACMLVLCLTCVGLALVPTDAYWLLMLLRCIQAAGSASTIALSAGVVADIAEQKERGTFFGFMNIGPMVGPCLGPVLGGALAQGLGWRSIFWFLAIASAGCFIILLLFLPETLRSIVGDGSIQPPVIYRPLIPLVGRHRHDHSFPDHPTLPDVAPRKFTNPLTLLTYPDLVLVLVYAGIINAVSYSLSASISTLFTSTYPWLTQTEIGLCFLAMGGGMMAGSVAVGQWLDWEFARFKKKLDLQDANESDGKREKAKTSKNGKEGQAEGFPVEKARLRTMPVVLISFVAFIVGYGWCLQAEVNLAVPLLLQIAVGFLVMTQMNTAQILIVDLFPNQGSTVSACSNLVRSSLGAAFVSVISLILDALRGPGWTFVLLGGISLLVAGPVLLIEMFWGKVWRERRRQQLARRTAA